MGQVANVCTVILILGMVNVNNVITLVMDVKILQPTV